MTTLFIADLHLDESRPGMTQLFFQFLQQQALQAEALYILGDLFEFWIGDDNLQPFQQEVINKLLQATQHGLPIYLMHGNRDFLIGKRFLNETGCRMLSDPSTINLYGTSTLLMHGDLLCTDDTQYLRFRRFARNVFLQRLFLSLPLAKRQTLAIKLRHKSRIHTSTTASAVMDVTDTAVTKVMQHYQVPLLIHGHTHRPAIHRFTLVQQPVMRIVLGPWHDSGSVLCFNTAADYQLLTY